MDPEKLSADHLLLINVLSQHEKLSLLGVTTAPTTLTGQILQISDTDIEQTLKAYENHKM